VQQLHDRVVFEPIHVEDMTPLERKRAMVESLIFLAEKRDETIKAQMCANGNTQRTYIAREEATSPTAATDAILITGVIEAKQRRDVMKLDVPNAFVQMPIPQNGEKIIMKIRGSLIDILTEICPGIYDNILQKKGKEMSYTLGCLWPCPVWYAYRIHLVLQKVPKTYDICVANRRVQGKQHTVTWHVDDVKSSHVISEVNDDFKAWCEEKYGNDETGHAVKAVHEGRHMIIWQ
jgi:hypothetical protein